MNNSFLNPKIFSSYGSKLDTKIAKNKKEKTCWKNKLKIKKLRHIAHERKLFYVFKLKFMTRKLFTKNLLKKIT